MSLHLQDAVDMLGFVNNIIIGIDHFAVAGMAKGGVSVWWRWRQGMTGAAGSLSSVHLIPNRRGSHMAVSVTASGIRAIPRWGMVIVGGKSPPGQLSWWRTDMTGAAPIGWHSVALAAGKGVR